MRKLPTLFLLLVSTAVAVHAESAPHWVEVRSEHFIVITDSSEKQARHAAAQFEQMRSLFHTILPAASDAPSPIIVFALKDKRSFATLEPSAYLQKNSLDLVGLFLTTPDQNYILLRLDSQDENPYATIYHEYTHFTTRKAVWMPLWLSEGLAEFYQNTTIEDKDALVGRASADDIFYLRDNRLLPLATVFAVDHDSPYYHDENKGSVFYSESWALTHMLEINDGANKTELVRNYIRLLAQNVDPVTAARQAFGDLDKLQKQLEQYILQSSYRMFRIKTTITSDENSYQAVPISVDDINAIRADVLVWDDRRPEAKALLEATLRDDPKNALAHESMGSLCYALRDAPCAQKWFGEAIELNVASYMADYFYAVMSMQDGDSGHNEKIPLSLLASIKLNPSYAPSYDALSSYYARQHTNLELAQKLSLKATQLEPEEVRYRIDAANIYMEQQQLDQAFAVLEGALKVAKKPEDIAMVEASIHQIDEIRKFAAQGGQVTFTNNSGNADEAAPHLQANTIPAAVTNTTRVGVPADNAAPPRTFPVTAPHAPHKVITGTLRNVHCSDPAILTLDVSSKGKPVSLFAPNFYKVSYTTLGFIAQDELKPCTEIEGMRANVTYAEAPDDTVSGEVIGIQLVK